MGRTPTPGRRPLGGGSARRPRLDDTLPGVQFPVVDDLGRIAADDEFLDAIAAGGTDLRSVFAAAGGIARGGPTTGDPAPVFDGAGGRPAGLGQLLVAWRSELLERPMPEPPTLAPRPMRAPADRSRRRSMRSLLSVGAAIGVLLMASTAVGAHSAQPGQPLWGLSQVLWSDHADSVQAKINVEAAFGLAKKALDEGNPQKAREVLSGLDGEVDKVLPADGQTALNENLKQLQQEAGVTTETDDPSGLGAPATVSTGEPGSSSSGAGVVPPLAASSSSVHPTTSTATSGTKPGTTMPSTTVGGGVVAGPTGAGPVGPPQSVTDLPIVPVLPGTSSSSVVPTNPVVAKPGTTVGPVTTAPLPGTTDGSTAPVEPSSPSPVDTTAPTTPAPATTADPTAPPSSSTEPPTPAAPTTTAPTTDAATTAPSTSSADPTTSSDVPTTDMPTSDIPTSDDPTTDTPTSVSTTSAIPTTLSSDPSTDSNGSTTSDTSSTVTQTAPVNDTDGSGPAGDPGTDTTATGDAGDAATPAEQSGP